MAGCRTLKTATAFSDFLQWSNRKQSTPPVTCLSPPKPWDEIMSVNPKVEKKSWKEEGIAAPEHGSFGCAPRVLKGLFIKCILGVSFKSWFCGFSAPWSQKETERHFVAHRFCNVLICVKTHQDPRSVWRTSASLPWSYSHGTEDHTCDLPQKTPTEAVLSRPWQQRRKESSTHS